MQVFIQIGFKNTSTKPMITDQNCAALLPAAVFGDPLAGFAQPSKFLLSAINNWRLSYHCVKKTYTLNVFFKKSMYVEKRFWRW